MANRHQKRNFNNKEAIVAIARELAEIRDRIYIMEMAFDMYIDFRKTSKSNGKKAFTKFMTDKMKEGQGETQRDDKSNGEDSKEKQANP